MPVTDRQPLAAAGPGGAGARADGPAAAGPPATGARRADGVARVVAPAVAAAGLVLEDVTTTPAGRRSVVRVVVDLPDDATGSVGHDEVVAVSRLVAAALDAPEGDEVLGSAPYVLEVSSPGVDRPLTQRRHWSRARGRLVSVRPAGGAPVPEPLLGRVARVDDAGVLLGDRLLGWPELEGAAGRVQVEFSRADEDSGAELDSDADIASDIDTDTDEEG